MWLIPTRNRPEMMSNLIKAMEACGELPDVAVMVDGEPYDIEWPSHWHIYHSDEHLEMQRSFNRLFQLHPNEKTYGILTDHSFPETNGWWQEMEATAGEWNVSFANDNHKRYNPRNGFERITISCYGGELIRELGWIWPDFCVHLYGDDALEDIINDFGLLKHTIVKFKDLQASRGEMKRDDNHKRLYKGNDYTNNDFLGYVDWVKNSKHNLYSRLQQKIPESARQKPLRKVNICCVEAGNYLGRGSEYVNILFDMIIRNLPFNVQYELICFTDNPSLVDSSIKTRPLPTPGLNGWWNKLSLFKRDLFKEGEQVIFFDLDTLIVGDLTDIVNYDGDFCTLRDFYRKDGLGSGLMSWKPEACYEIWNTWNTAGFPEISGGDQAWIEKVIKGDIWQDVCVDKVFSYKAHCKPYPPQTSSVICFHGEPRPHSCSQKWVQDIWKIGGSSALNLTVMPNLSNEKVFENILSNANRAKWLRKSPEHDQIAVICGSGPSLIDTIDTIKEYVEVGAVVFCLNNAAKVLKQNGITANYQVILDARPGNAEFIDKTANAYLIASQCDPSVFDALEGETVCLWHPMMEGIDEMFPDHNLTLVGGGTTVGLSSMALAYTMGFRKFALFGYDSSFKNGKMHATPQSRTEAEKWSFEVTAGEKTFLSNAAMAKQAELFPLLLNELLELDCEIRVYGEGLLPYISELYAAQTLST